MTINWYKLFMNLALDIIGISAGATALYVWDCGAHGTVWYGGIIFLATIAHRFLIRTNYS
jgi:hypothetical protein